MKTWLTVLLVWLSLITTQASENKSHIIHIGQLQFRALQVSPSHLSLHWKNSQGSPYSRFGALKSDLEKKGKQVIALMNAGIYSKNDQPAGLHIEAGKTLKSLNTQRGGGNFHLQPNGVFYITNKNTAHIKTTASYKKRYGKNSKGVRLATQSGPLLLINGKINRRFIANSKSPYTRNGICTTRSGTVFFIATEGSTQSNLYQFAQAAKKMGCYQALYLDGSISKIYQRGVNSTFHFRHFVGILAVTE